MSNHGRRRKICASGRVSSARYIALMSDTNFDQKPERRAGPPLLACYDDLAASCDYGWSMLARGVKDRKSAFHTPSVATLRADGTPAIRTVVLRGCDIDKRHVRFHTDTRSGKIADMQRDPRAAMHFYDAGAKLQLRLSVRLEALSGADYDAAWSATRPMSRECYQVTTAPGSPLGDPYEVAFDAAATQEGEDYFVPVRAHVEQMEWLYLAAKGHRRALFDFVAGTQSWLVP